MRLLCLILCAWLCTATHADTVKVAVASNFRPLLNQLAERFEAECGHQLRISSGASGVLMQQIRYGADFHVFLSADSLRPQILYKEGLASEPVTYATGLLALVATDPLPATLSRDALRRLLVQAPDRSVALADPDTAPYGHAARALYESLDLWQSSRPSRVEAPNIAQTYLLVERRHAQLGFVAAALLGQGPLKGVVLPGDWYPPIHQQAVLLQSAVDHRASQAFMQFLLRNDTQQFIVQHGYRKTLKP